MLGTTNYKSPRTLSLNLLIWLNWNALACILSDFHSCKAPQKWFAGQLQRFLPKEHTHKHSTIRFNSFSDFIDFLSSQNAAEMTSLFIRHSVWRYKGSTRTTWLLPLTALDFWNPNIIVPANSLILWRFPLRAIQTSTSVRSESYCIRQEAPFLSQSPS